VAKDPPLKKNDLIVITGAGGFIAGAKLKRHNDLNAPRGVAGRNSDNTFIKSVLGWEPDTPLNKGLALTYKWIREQYHNRKMGWRVVE